MTKKEIKNRIKYLKNKIKVCGYDSADLQELAILEQQLNN